MLAPRYRPVTYEDVPQLKRAMRRVPEEFRASDLLPHLPEVLRDLEPREIGRALLYRGLAERAGDHQLRRRHVSHDQGGRAAEVPGLSERPHHTPAAEQAVLHGLLGGMDSGERTPAQEAAGEVFQVLKETDIMEDEIATQSESQMCADCAKLNSAVCDVCHDKSEWTAKQKKRGKKTEEVPKTPVVHEDGTIEGTITNPEALDALERCKCHGGTVELKDGVLFCTTCGLAVPHPLPVASLKCSDCDDVNIASRCIYCDGDPNEDRAGDKFIPEDRPSEAIEAEPVEEQVLEDEPNWDTYHDRSAEAPDLMMEEGQGEPQHALVPIDAPSEPWWTGGPLDTVTPEGESIGLPWHTAVLKLPAGEYMILTEGRYNYGGVEATTTRPTIIKDPTDPDTVIQSMLLDMELDARLAAEESSRTDYKPGHRGQSTLDGEPMVRGSIERKPVIQVKIEVDKFLLRTTEEGLERAMDREPEDLEQWIYRKMRPLGKDTFIGKDDWAEGMRQLRKVIEGAD